MNMRMASARDGNIRQCFLSTEHQDRCVFVFAPGAEIRCEADQRKHHHQHQAFSLNHPGSCPGNRSCILLAVIVSQKKKKKDDNTENTSLLLVPYCGHLYEDKSEVVTQQDAQITCCGQICQHEHTDQLSESGSETFLPSLLH